ncbi:MAG: hypothetical protein HQK52_04405 [Oligoflexia bacterium]|nr:hypothetical protein [Oligoflexia bacterium]
MSKGSKKFEKELKRRKKLKQREQQEHGHAPTQAHGSGSRMPPDGVILELVKKVVYDGEGMPQEGIVMLEQAADRSSGPQKLVKLFLQVHRHFRLNQPWTCTIKDLVSLYRVFESNSMEDLFSTLMGVTLLSNESMITQLAQSPNCLQHWPFTSATGAFFKEHALLKEAWIQPLSLLDNDKITFPLQLALLSKEKSLLASAGTKHFKQELTRQLQQDKADFLGSWFVYKAKWASDLVTSFEKIVKLKKLNLKTNKTILDKLELQLKSIGGTSTVELTPSLRTIFLWMGEIVESKIAGGFTPEWFQLYPCISEKFLGRDPINFLPEQDIPAFMANAHKEHRSFLFLDTLEKRVSPVASMPKNVQLQFAICRMKAFMKSSDLLFKNSGGSHAWMGDTICEIFSECYALAREQIPVHAGASTNTNSSALKICSRLIDYFIKQILPNFANASVEPPVLTPMLADFPNDYRINLLTYLGLLYSSQIHQLNQFSLQLNKIVSLEQIDIEMLFKAVNSCLDEEHTLKDISHSFYQKIPNSYKIKFYQYMTEFLFKDGKSFNISKDDDDDNEISDKEFAGLLNSLYRYLPYPTDVLTSTNDSNRNRFLDGNALEEALFHGAVYQYVKSGCQWPTYTVTSWPIAHVLILIQQLSALFQANKSRRSDASNRHAHWKKKGSIAFLLDFTRKLVATLILVHLEDSRSVGIAMEQQKQLQLAFAHLGEIIEEKFAIKYDAVKQKKQQGVATNDVDSRRRL